MKFRNPMEKSSQPKPRLEDLAVDYLNTLHAVKETTDKILRGEGCDREDLQILKELGSKLKALRDKGVTDEHLMASEERTIDFQEEQLNRYEEETEKYEAKLADLESKKDPTEEDLAQMMILRDRLYGAGGTNEDRRTHGMRTWLDTYALGERERFVEKRKLLKVKYPSSKQE